MGILTGILYGNNIRAVLDDKAGINLGSVYESVVASELTAHGVTSSSIMIIATKVRWTTSSMITPPYPQSPSK